MPDFLKKKEETHG